MTDSIRRCLQVCSEQEQEMDGCPGRHASRVGQCGGREFCGWPEILEGDQGFVKVSRRVELHGLRRRERREQARRWRLRTISNTGESAHPAAAPA